MNEKLVSIIVPVYNVENYLECCIKSLVTQSYTMIQIILIDDGSTDKSGSICDRWASKDNRISVIHKDNEGISATRNIGLSRAVGDYVLFVDSDDWIDKEMVHHLVQNGDEMDVVVCGSNSYAQSGRLVSRDKLSEQYYSSNKDIQTAYMQGTIKSLFYGPVAKLYKLQTIRSITFDTNLQVAEDIVFNLNVLKIVSKVKVIPFWGYNIRLHENSTTHKTALKYTYLYEHDYVAIKEAVFKSKKEWLVNHERYLIEDYNRTCLMRFYNEMSNLFRRGNPYGITGRYEKVRTIHKDNDFIKSVKANNYQNLGRAEKISWILARFDCPLISYLCFCFLITRKRR